MKTQNRNDRPSRWARFVNWMAEYGSIWMIVIGVTTLAGYIGGKAAIGNMPPSIELTDEATASLAGYQAQTWEPTTDAEIMHENQVTALIHAMETIPGFSNPGLESDTTDNRWYTYQNIEAEIADGCILQVMKSSYGPSIITLIGKDEKAIKPHLKWAKEMGLEYEYNTPTLKEGWYAITYLECPPGWVNSYIELPTDLYPE